MKWEELKLRGIIGTDITVDGETMKVTDYCRGCRKLWAETMHHKLYLSVKRGGLYVKERKLKPLD